VKGGGWEKEEKKNQKLQRFHLVNEKQRLFKPSAEPPQALTLLFFGY
jgi:hypothetical protein